MQGTVKGNSDLNKLIQFSKIRHVYEVKVVMFIMKHLRNANTEE